MVLLQFSSKVALGSWGELKKNPKIEKMDYDHFPKKILSPTVLHIWLIPGGLFLVSVYG